MKTIKQLADENKVSKTTIRRYMKKINADAVTNENGISLIDDDTANVISDMLKQNKPEQKQNIFSRLFKIKIKLPKG